MVFFIQLKILIVNSVTEIISICQVPKLKLQIIITEETCLQD